MNHWLMISAHMISSFPNIFFLFPLCLFFSSKDQNLSFILGQDNQVCLHLCILIKDQIAKLSRPFGLVWSFFNSILRLEEREVVGHWTSDAAGDIWGQMRYWSARSSSTTRPLLATTTTTTASMLSQKEGKKWANYESDAFVSYP